MTNKKIILLFAILATAQFAFAQKDSSKINIKIDTLKSINFQPIEEVIIKYNQIQQTTTNNNVIGKRELSLGNSGRDIPILLQQLPNVITTSDAGNGIGYTGIRVRGSDATRTNVTVNGVPINDAESQGTFWVNMPDLVSSAGSITLQRGLGTSLSGAGAFGASLHVQTDESSETKFNVSYGSFNSHKITAQFGNSILLKNKNQLKFNGRVSYIQSDGFIDRASSILGGYLASAGYYAPTFSVKLLAFGGMEKTYQAWYGIPIEKYNLGNPNRKNTTADSAALWDHYVRNAGPGYTYQTSADSLNLFQSAPNKYNYYQYPNQTDNYQQHHVHLYLNKKLSKQANINTTLYYTHGEGYYAEFKYSDKLSNYGLPNITIPDTLTISMSNSNLTRKRWLSNNLIGINTNYTYENQNSIFTFGGSTNYYVGQHYGIVDTVFSATPLYIKQNLPNKYYQNTGYKTDISIFIKFAQKITGNLNYYIDLQGRKVIYNGSGIENNFQAVNFVGNYSFMNPKAGFNYSFQDKGNALGIISSSINGSFGAGYKEPARTDFTDNNNSLVPKPEQLLDYELGYQFDIQKLKEYGSLVSMNINGYYMDYRNQLVLTGALNDVGSALRVNVPKSYRTGIEIDGNVLIFDNSLSTLKKISHEVRFIGNISLSKNIIEKSPASWLDYATSEKVDSTFHNAPISYSPNYVGSIGVNYRIGFWKRTVNEERTISISKSSLNFRLNTKIVGQQYLDNTGDETRKLDNYNFTEFMINYNHVLKINKSSINFKFQMNNLFNQYYANNGYTWGYMYGNRNVIQEVYLFPSASRNINFSIGYTF
jgi:iron complex outermembrane receptor protein